MSVDLILLLIFSAFLLPAFVKVVNGGKHDHHSSSSVNVENLILNLISFPGPEAAPEEKTVNTKIWSLTSLMMTRECLSH